MAFQRFKSPTLPVPPVEYEESYFMNLIRGIGAYFDIHDSKAGLNIDSVISDFIQLPIGALTLSNGANSNIALPKKSFARITGPSADFNINLSFASQSKGGVFGTNIFVVGLGVIGSSSII